MPDPTIVAAKIWKDGAWVENYQQPEDTTIDFYFDEVVVSEALDVIEESENDDYGGAFIDTFVSGVLT